MSLITRDHLGRWADDASAKSTFPQLISRLVRATTPIDTKITIPWGSATYIGGWDGIVRCNQQARYVPSGVSVWEFGTSKDYKKKANEDYGKRKKEPLGFDPKDVTFIFVTPRTWSDKNEWIQRHKDENFWGDVIVYDGIDLEQWLDESPAVVKWLGVLLGINTDESITLEEYWEEWANSEGYSLSPDCVLAGRKKECDELQARLGGKPSIIGIKASTPDEALAFIAAAIKTLDPDISERCLSTTLIADSEPTFRRLSDSVTTSLNLVARIDNPLVFERARAAGHHVLVPLATDDPRSIGDIITLPPLNREKLIETLEAIGLSAYEVRRYIKESAHDITILRKLLGFPDSGARWLQTQSIEEIIPALLLGRWNEDYPGDIELIEKLSGEKYSDYLVTLQKWQSFSRSPLIQIGHTWRLTSSLEIWSSLATRLVAKDFNALKECFELAYHSNNPIIDTPYNSIVLKRKYSDWAREGLAQSLILVAITKGINSVYLGGDPQIWVDRVVENLLNNADGETWISVDKELPLIAEASPRSFIKALQRSLGSDRPEAMKMFEEKDGFISKTSNHTGLLWALEELAWFPEYLKDASLLLARLTQLDPGGQLSNRPMNSLTEIFLPWHYQTMASLDERVKALRLIAQKEKAVCWDILLKLLPNGMSVSWSTHKMRWRIFRERDTPTYTYQEMWASYSIVVDMLLEICDKDEKALSTLIEIASRKEIGGSMQKKILSWVQTVIHDVAHEEHLVWKTLRKILGQHRAYPDAQWSYTEEELKPFEEMFLRLEPTDLIARYSWLFDDVYPQIPEKVDMTAVDSDKGELVRLQLSIPAQIQGAKELVSHLGLERVLGLRLEVKEPQVLGKTLAKLITKEKEIEIVLYTSLDDDNTYIRFAYEFISEVVKGKEPAWLENLVTRLLEQGCGHKAIANLLIGVSPGTALWSYLETLSPEIQELYWRRLFPHFVHLTDQEIILGVSKLLEYDRAISAVNAAWPCRKRLPSYLLIEVLHRAGVDTPNESKKIMPYKIESVFEELDTRTDVEEQELLDLETLYIPTLTSYDSTRGATSVEDELANNPVAFITILKYLSKPNDENLLAQEQKGLSPEQLQNMATRAWYMLSSWSKIPGMNSDSSIDREKLRAWVERARALAQEASKLEVADEEIGKLFAKYPQDSPFWPEFNIFQMIEDINTEEIKRGYYIGLFNRQGVSCRGFFDGGDIERDRAAYFRDLARATKHDYPAVSEIFEDLERDYLSDARRQDNQATRDALDY